MHFLGSPEKHKFCPKWRIYFEELVDPFFTLIFLPAFPPEWQPWWLFAGTGVIFRQPNSLRGLFYLGRASMCGGGLIPSCSLGEIATLDRSLMSPPGRSGTADGHLPPPLCLSRVCHFVTQQWLGADGGIPSPGPPTGVAYQRVFFSLGL